MTCKMVINKIAAKKDAIIPSIITIKTDAVFFSISTVNYSALVADPHIKDMAKSG